MKLLTLSGFTLGVLSAQAQIASIYIPQDTVIQSDTVFVTPYLSGTLTHALGNFAVVGSDQIALHTYAGLNVFNTLRGHVPNFYLGLNTYPALAGLRSFESLMVIDGLPYGSGFSSFYNLNSFEYKNPLAINSGNGAALYGGAAHNGAFFLQSKTGENFNRPSFEFNSSTTLLANELTTYTVTESETVNQLMLTNAFAYNQDFGAIDTRVSYTFSHWPDGNSMTQRNTNHHNLRLNTGFDITPRFKARLILDDFYNRSESAQEVANANEPFDWYYEDVKKNLQGNLQLQYQIADWLSISSQTSLGKIEQNNRTEFVVNGNPNGPITKRRQDRNLANLYLSFSKSLSPDFIVKAFAGYQYRKVKSDEGYHYINNDGAGGAFSENKTKSTIGGLGLQYRNYLFTDFNFTNETVSVYSDENNQVPTYSFNTSFIFSEALGWQNSDFSYGKFRFSLGSSGVALHQGYPREWRLWQNFYNYQYPNPDLHASRKRMLESGVDLAFLKGRLLLNATLFSDFHKEIASVITVPDYTNGSAYLTANLWNLRSNGWEMKLSGAPVKKNNVSVTTSLVLATLNNKLTSDFSMDSGDSKVFTGSFLTQVTFNDFFFSLLIEGHNGSSVDNLEASVGGGIIYNLKDASMAYLRDLSIGYRLPANALEKLKIREAQVSLSGRNFWTLYYKTKNETESSSGRLPQQGATLSFTLLF